MTRSKAGPLFFAFFLTVTFLACNNEKNPAQQYGSSMVQSLNRAKSVDNQVNVETVLKSIQEFHAANGRYPANLDELSAFNGIKLKTDQFDYDPTSGMLSEKR